MNLVVLSEISAKDLTRTSCINEAIQLFEYALVGALEAFLGAVRMPSGRPLISARLLLFIYDTVVNSREKTHTVKKGNNF